MTSEREPTGGGISTSLEVREAPLPAMAPMVAMEPAIRLDNAKKLARLLADVIEERKLYTEITNWNPRTQRNETKKHVRFEGWTTTGALCGQVLGDGVFPVSVWTRPLPFPAGTTADDFSYERGRGEAKQTITPAVYGFEARVEARTYSGAVVAAAEGEVTRAEKRWAKADDYAIRSMVQTRVGSKALRVPLGWIISLSGFAETPAEEMASEERPDNGAPATRSGKWGCADCRTINAARAKACKKCGRQRGAPVEEAEQPAPGAQEPPPAAQAGEGADLEKEAGHAPPGADPEPTEFAEGNWRCRECETVNASDAPACRKCGVLPDGSAPSDPVLDPAETPEPAAASPEEPVAP